MNVVAEDKVKGLLITKAAIKTLLPESVIEKIIDFQFKDANEQVLKVDQIEFSGLGTFKVSPSKIKNRIVVMERTIAKMEKGIADLTTPEWRLPGMRTKLASATKALEFLKNKNQRYEN